MRFSVLICTHNRCELLKRSLETVGQQRLPSDRKWEIVVVDNSSSDRTRQVVEDFRTSSRVPVQYLFEARLGHSIALNSGIRACRGDVIAFTDDDACPLPDWLRELHAAFEEYHAHWVLGRVMPLWEGSVPRWFSERFNGYFALLDYGPQPFIVTDPQHSFYGVNCACRREALEALGGYREDLGPFGNRGGVGADTDLFERALAKGMLIVYAPGAVVRHIIPKWRATKRHQRRKVWIGSADYYRFLRENPPDVPWLLGLPRYLFRIAVGDLLAYSRSLARNDRSDAFYHELQMIRFMGLFYQAYRHGLRNAPQPDPVRLASEQSCGGRE